MAASLKMRTISSIVAFLVLGPSLQAQTGDWRAVENLKPGTRISVKARHRILCVFQAATDDELVCKPLRFSRLGPAESRFDRQTVREVRLPPNQAKDAWIGAGIGAGAGAITGASRSGTSPGADAFFGALAGALVGGVAGSMVPIFRHGTIIYKR